MEKVAASDRPPAELVEKLQSTWDLALKLVPIAWLNAPAFQNRNRDLVEALEVYRNAPSKDSKTRLQEQMTTFKANVLGC
jgi:hypothetical protein